MFEDSIDRIAGRVNERVGEHVNEHGNERPDGCIEDKARALPNAGRRDLLRAAGLASVGGIAGALAAGATAAVAQPAQPAPRAGGSAGVAAGVGTSLGARLRGVQHFGLTVQNMDRAFAFYTEVLGGTEILRDGNFSGEKIQNTLLLTEEIRAREAHVNPRAIGVPDLRSGAQRLDVRFVQFDNVVLELLQYRDREQPQGSGDSYAPPHDLTSPAYPRSMHICFYIRDDVDFNQFVRDLEAESARRGMTNVKANRIVTARTDQERLALPVDTNTNRITEGPSDGWSLIYCKGPEGEQLEFVQVLGRAKQTFGNAYETRRRAVGDRT
ncbi:VOC family protein [Cupriavidus plantarum]|uniref:VOC family protein n=1 Tax=Cupriavidus plantarum TaxID=942865 RepID=UPI000E265F43|nr:VOC family protein [Cupriavidus plantarum]NYI00307.1 catechol 2,3-dioxygenase-like lactoylglutathione lyase family enzyme [Cupriavidus plantarum]REE89129.1 glyoxalase/bleomycin resistance protein/dioxygenase superfamily protein [Cupriavidus plantarum]